MSAAHQPRLDVPDRDQEAMAFRCQAEELAAALDLACRTLPPRAAAPPSCRLRAGSGTVCVESLPQGAAMLVRCGADVAAAGEAVVSPFGLLDWLKGQAGAVCLRLRGEGLHAEG